ncbi:uncharacterized protein METZ01_LOCUS4526 [marine metagenome]|uniref:Uncharacterized protein n=1 Tax=marine metagenome TaxID=408172 RepID=A0A381NAR0_9ZZZZ
MFNLFLIYIGTFGISSIPYRTESAYKPEPPTIII